MCDTLAATPAVTATGSMLFAKNSDRERNEAQALETVPRRLHAPGTRVRLTYLEIDQAPETHACLISRPFWMWGAEMGANDHGVVIGNEAMFSIVPAQRRPALTGMDLVRLGLERAASAADAVEVITGLLERHGQGGDCGHLSRFYYHNGFVIADPGEAFVLETVGRGWAVERIDGVRALSNALSIGRTPIRVGDALNAHAVAEGWTDRDGRFDLAERLSDPVKDAGSFGRGRCARATALLSPQGRSPRTGRLVLADLLAVLRDHGAEAEGDPDWSPSKTLHRSICMHAGPGARRSQSVASMGSDLTPGRITHWVTGTSAPCLSLFKPVVLGLPLPAQGPTPGDRYDPASLWWRHERLHRVALGDLPSALALISGERDALEAGFRIRMDAAWRRGEAAVAETVAACWAEAAAAEERWRAALPALRAATRRLTRSMALSWARLNTAAGFPTR
jgi:dipeptidase